MVCTVALPLYHFSMPSSFVLVLHNFLTLAPPAPSMLSVFRILTCHQGSVVGWPVAQHLSLSQKFFQSKELTFLISPASVVTLCMSPFSGFLAQGGSRFLYLTSVCSKNKRPKAKDFSAAGASVGDSLQTMQSRLCGSKYSLECSDFQKNVTDII